MSRFHTLIAFVCIAVALAGVTRVPAQTITWQGTAGDFNWFTGSNWTGSTAPSNVKATIALTGPAYSITTNAHAGSVNLQGLDLTSGAATLLLDFSSTSYGLTLGTSTSNWSAGTVEVRNSNGVYGSGAANTFLNVASGVELRYSTSTATRYLYNLTAANAGTIHATSGTLSLNNLSLTNQAGGLIHADGAEIDVASNTTLNNLGTLRATGAAGKLYIQNSLTTANLGTVDLVSGGHAYLSGTLDNSAATLAKPNGGSLELLGGTINNGTIATGAVTFTTTNSTLANVSLQDDLTLGDSQRVRFSLGTGFTGANATLGNYSLWYWNQAGTLAGKAVTMNYASSITVQNGNSLTLGGGTTVSGDVDITTDNTAGTAITNLGNITHSNGYGSLFAATFTNSGSITANNGANLTIGDSYYGYANLNTSTGTITVDGANSLINLDGNLTNQGTLVATNSGQLKFQGNMTTGNLGTVQLGSGGQALLNGTLDNGNATLAAPTGGKFELYAGTITNGAIGPGALKFTSANGTLSNVSIQDDLTLGPSERVTFTNGSGFTGGNATLGNYSVLYWNQGGALNGKTVTMDYGSSIYVQYGNTITLGPATTVGGDVDITTDNTAGSAITNQGNITHSSSYGSIYSPNLTNSGSITANSGADLTIGYTSYNTTNTSTGTITADGTNAVVRLSGPVVNQGTMSAVNTGELLYQGPTTTANLGNVQLAGGGRALLNGTLDNTNATLTAPAGGAFELYNGTILGGTIGPGALTYTSSSGTLNGVWLNDDLTLPANTDVAFTNGSMVGSGNITLGANAIWYLNQSGTIEGATITQGAGSLVYVQGNNTLSLAGGTLTGTVYLSTDGSSGAAITTGTTITHNSGYGYMQAATLTNTGNVTATSGSALTLGSTYYAYNTTNTGTVTADGANTRVYLAGNVTNQGALVAQNAGELIFVGNNATGNLGNVQLASGGRALLNGTLDNTSATLTAPAGGTFELYGGTITNGSIAAGALTFTGSSGTLSNVSLAGDLTLPASTGVAFTGGSAFSGGNATLGTNSTLTWNQAGTLTTKSVTFAGGASLYLAGNHTLTFDAGTSLAGDVYLRTDGSTGNTFTNLGNITHSSGYGYVQAPTVSNAGTITANSGANLTLGYGYNGYQTINTSTGTITSDGANTIVYLAGDVSNQGTVAAKNGGKLIYSDNNVTGNLGNVQLATGGRALLGGMLDNTGATLTAPLGGIFELYGGTLTNGNVGLGALGYTGSGGTLDHVIVFDDLNLPASTSVTITDGTSFVGGNATLGTNATLRWKQTDTVEGKTVTFGSGASVYLMGNNTLTVAANTTVSGDLSIYTDGSAAGAITNQGNITHNSSYGYLQAPTLNNAGNIKATAGSDLTIGYTYNSYQTNNQPGGTITADGANTVIELEGGLSNQGTIIAQNSGAVKIQGNVTTANLGTIQIVNGGHVYLDGLLDNSSATLTAPSGGAYELYSGTIRNGTVAAGALAFTGSSGTLDHVALQGDLSFPTYTYARFTNGTSLAANAAVALGNGAGLEWNQAGTLSGNALTFGSGAYLYLSGGNSAVTFDAATTATGDVSLYSDGSGGTAITNLGSLTHTSGTGYMYADSFTNSGTVTITSGIVYFGANTAGTTVANTATGTLRLNGGSLYLQPPAASPLVNAGLIDVQSGTFYTNNRLTNGPGKITGAGIVNGGLILAGGEIAPGNSGIGTLTFSSGTLTVTSASTFDVEVGGSIADQLKFISPPAAVDLGAGLLTLNLSLISAPTPNTTFNIVNISSGGFGITGTFAGLPSSGSALTVNFGGNPYTFTLNYQPNFVALAYNPVLVPEPGTYALMSAGLLALALAYRRRRRT